MTAAMPAFYEAMMRPLRDQPERIEMGDRWMLDWFNVLPASEKIDGALGNFCGVPVVFRPGMGNQLLRIIERDGRRRLLVDDGTCWHCEGEAVGIYNYGICSPGNPIHYSPCGWRPGDGWRSVHRLRWSLDEAAFRREYEGRWP